MGSIECHKWKISKYSIPVVLAALVLTGRTQDNSTQQQQTEQQRQQLEQQREQLRQRSQQLEQQTDQQQQQLEQQRERQQRQQQLQRDQQQQATQQQRNQQSVFQPGRISDSQLKKEVTDVNKASSFIGMAVKNTQNEDLGKVSDLVFDPQKGKISYAVLSVGGVLGVGDKLVAVPVTSLRPQPGQNYLTLNMQKSQIESAPGLAQNNWPDLDAPGLGGAAGSESGASTTSQDSQGSSPSSTSSSSSDQSTSSPSDKSSTDQPSDKKQSSSSSSQGSSPGTSTGSNSDSSSSSSSSSDSSSTDSSSTQGETKKTDQ